ncbi:serine/threonine protein kinase DUN1 NDAI_0B03190 [Naumovozyma dairenensis CBS 421]|uniref:DNA damage response protein kinase DUN1 n=1 Tax=Naumovozyma dairenensis (strain ATCC 10597 / BCRC 20456 / CBS 421 / NBRC 0211 / NRRL Y-12639) TaxID=1071378 RepID=G0W6E3_NAUDC|nr:hypothetical protein NDAI_0B03190 [Naumovozyma dairenensis CBS 421]CCD23354.1 hypothetical protein NDAI_0B03190 [Naumovozyma dairenensis CBS 421]
MTATTATAKRGLSGEVPASVKRQQTIVGEMPTNTIATLVSLIPGKEQIINIDAKSVTTIGRSRSCDIVLTETDISTVHCELYLIEMNMGNNSRSLINIVDKSRNGTFINGNRLVKKDCILKNGDRVVLGKACSFLFKYTITDANTDFPEDNSVEASSETSPQMKDPEKYDGVFKKVPANASRLNEGGVRKIAKPKTISFFDKYLLGKDLGSGHYATVKQGINKINGQTVAVKIFHPQQNDDQKKNKQFKEETSILMRIHHKNIVNLLDSFIEPISKSQIQKYLVLEMIYDGELFERVVKKTTLRQDETKAIFSQILTGLKYLHQQNIIHRDIKPENILLNITKRTNPEQKQLGPWDENEIDIQVKIADFGLAKFTGEMQFTNTLCGTPSYVAPEVLTKKGYTSKVDMWSAGVILYVCLCGFPPFSDQLGPPSLKEQILQAKYAFYTPYWDNIDDSILHLISNLLVLDANKRYSVDDAINHPWFNDTRQENTVSLEMKRLQITDNKVPKTYSELSCL